MKFFMMMGILFMSYLANACYSDSECNSGYCCRRIKPLRGACLVCFTTQNAETSDTDTTLNAASPTLDMHNAQIKRVLNEKFNMMHDLEFRVEEVEHKLAKVAPLASLCDISPQACCSACKDTMTALVTAIQLLGIEEEEAMVAAAIAAAKVGTKAAVCTPSVNHELAQLLGAVLPVSVPDCVGGAVCGTLFSAATSGWSPLAAVQALLKGELVSCACSWAHCPCCH